MADGFNETGPLVAVMCRFKRESDSKWEPGMAITHKPFAADIITIVPEDATSAVDVMHHWFVCELLWQCGKLVMPPESAVKTVLPADAQAAFDKAFKCGR